MTGCTLHFKKIPLAAGLRTDHRGQEKCRGIGNINEFPQFLALTWTCDLTSLCLSFLIYKVGIIVTPHRKIKALRHGNQMQYMILDWILDGGKNLSYGGCF